MKTQANLKKIAIMLVTSLIMLSILFSQVVLATVANETELKQTVARYNDDNPESTKYLVTDEMISNVAPGTKYGDFKKNIEEGTEIFIPEELTLEDPGNNTPTDDDYMKTGMRIVYNQNNRIYDLSVYGDIDKDSLLNQIDLTRLIRHLVNADGWSLEEVAGGVQKNIKMRSADMNYDKDLSDEDITGMTDYIVFDRLNIREYPVITKPEVKVIEGRLAPSEDRYDTDVKVKVEAKDESGVKTIYKKLGTSQTEYAELNNENKEISVTEDGVYRIVAYTYGPEGNKSKGASITFVREKKLCTITYSPGEFGTFEEQTKVVPEGDTVPGFEGTPTVKPGYEFDKWIYPDGTPVNPEDPITDDTIIIPGVKATEYNINYDLKGGALPEGVTNPDKFTVDTETFTLNNPEKAGYEFIGWTMKNANGELQEGDPQKTVTIAKGTRESRTYIANWKLTEYDITYDYNKGELPEGVTNPDKFTIETENITIHEPVREGYEFIGWTINNGTNVVPTGAVEESIENGTTLRNIILIAQWRANSDTRYTVVHIRAKLDGTYDENDATLVETQTGLTGTTDTEVTAEPKTYPGFAVDNVKSANTRTGIIAGNGSTVLTIYYLRNEYDVSVIAGIGIASISGAGTYKYGQEVTIGATPLTGYTFGKWTGGENASLNNSTENPKKFNMPAGNVEVTANGTANTNTGYKVKHIRAKLDGTYDENDATLVETQTDLTGTTGKEVTAVQKTYDGFAVDEAKSSTTRTGIIAGNGSTVLKIYYLRKQYNISLIAGTGIESVTLTINDTTTTEERIDKENVFYKTPISISAKEINGFEFEKWESGTEAVEDSIYKSGDFNMPNGQVILTAKGHLKNYSITYELNGGALATGVQNPDKFTVETETFSIKNPSKLGYSFLGWREIKENGTDDPDDNYEVKKGTNRNLHLEAVYQANSNTPYTIEYYLMNEIGSSYVLNSSKTDYGYTDSKATVKSADKKSFTGFTLNEGKSTLSATIAADGTTKLKLLYDRNKTTLTIKPNGGSWNNTTSNSTYTQYYGTTLTIAVPTRTNYNFSGWSKTGGGSITSKTPTSSASQVYTFGETNGEITASWTIMTSTLTVNPNGGSWAGSTSNTSYTRNAATTISIAVPTRSGYEFTGWTKNGGGIITNNSPTASATQTFTFGTSNTTLTANWRLISSTLTVNPNGGSWQGYTSSKTYTYGQGATLSIPIPTRSGYEFTGWTHSGGGLLTAIPPLASTTQTFTFGSTNATLTAGWKQSMNWTIKYDSNSGGYATGYMANQTVSGSTSATLNANGFSRTGFTFEGWSTSPTATYATYSNRGTISNSVNNNTITLYAVWSINYTFYSLSENATVGETSGWYGDGWTIPNVKSVKITTAYSGNDYFQVLSNGSYAMGPNQTQTINNPNPGGSWNIQTQFHYSGYGYARVELLEYIDWNGRVYSRGY